MKDFAAAVANRDRMIGIKEDITVNGATLKAGRQIRVPAKVFFDVMADHPGKVVNLTLTPLALVINNNPLPWGA